MTVTVDNSTDFRRVVRIRVPGTSANLGPGFDTLGLACTIYNELELSLNRTGNLTIEMSGEGHNNIPRDERNIVWRSVKYLLERAEKEREFIGGTLRMSNRIPLSRGLGSSAAAIVAGLKAANVLLNNPFNRHELLQFATDIEGHPDNVAPAIYGGITINTVTGSEVECFTFLPKLWLRLIVMVPNFYLSTKAAREVLPKEITRAEAVFNIGHASMLIAALMKGADKFLKNAFEDVLHQPHRASLIPGMFDIIKAAKEAGAYGAALSGAGPCLIAFAPEDRDTIDRISKAMQQKFAEYDVTAYPLHLRLDTKGARVMR